MGKTVYITEAQFDKLKKYIQESENALDITVSPEEGQSAEDAIETTKNNIEQVAGSQVADSANFTLKGSAFEGKSFSKKDIEKSRLHKILKEGKTFSKKEFTKLMLNENTDLFWNALEILRAYKGEIEVEDIASEMGYTPNDAEWNQVMAAIDEAEMEYWQDNGRPQAWWGNH